MNWSQLLVEESAQLLGRKFRHCLLAILWPLATSCRQSAMLEAMAAVVSQPEVPPRAPLYLKGSRDLRIDLLRGAAVAAMVIDHVGGDRSWLYALTGGDKFYVSAAEAFVFLAGI